MRLSTAFWRRPGILAAVCTLTLASGWLVAACGGAQSPAESSSPLAQLSLELLDPGDAPRRILSYDVPEGTTERLSLTMVVGAVATVGTASLPELISAPVTLDLVVGPFERLPDRGIRYGLEITRVSIDAGLVDDRDVAEITRRVSPLFGIHGWIEADAHGLTRDAAFEVPADVPLRTRVILGNVVTALVSVPFPADPVGQGARWEVRRTIDLGGFQVSQRINYALAAVNETADSGRLIFRVHQSGTPMTMEIDPGVEAYVEAYDTIGVGEVTFGLDRLTPESVADADNLLWATVTGPSGSVPLQIRSFTTVRVQPAD